MRLATRDCYFAYAMILTRLAHRLFETHTMWCHYLPDGWELPLHPIIKGSFSYVSRPVHGDRITHQPHLSVMANKEQREAECVPRLLVSKDVSRALVSSTLRQSLSSCDVQ